MRDKWRGAGAGRRYVDARWSSERRRQRDPRLVAALLARHLPGGPHARLLDVPCGSGRLRATLVRHGDYLGLDASPAMLEAAREEGARAHELVLGEVERLPFPDDAFDAVVCCRLLHHVQPAADLERILAELVRVTRTLLVVSFWDAGSLAAWRRRVAARAAGRHARQRAELAAALERAGARVVGWKHSLRFVSQQAFVAARKR